jgi:asparagine synthase (glutamine-hydrolysing)
MELLAADAGAAIMHPLATRSFRRGFASAAPRYGFHRGRPEAIRACFGGLLPPRLLERDSKARFEGAFWGAASRAFAASWDGTGTDPSVVDACALRAEWALEEPDAHTYLLLQHLWLERSANGRLKKGHLGLSVSGARI